MTPDPFSATAAYLCQLGIKIFPLRWQSKAPVLQGNWKHYATADWNRFQNLIRGQRQWNLAVRLGPDSGILDFELDSVEAANEFQMLEQVFGPVETVAYRSRRGIHRWFKWSSELGGMGNAVPKYRGMELRLGTSDKGAYSVVPPSLHESGETWYQWLPGCAPWERPIARMPVWLENLFLTHNKVAGKSTVEVARVGDDFIPEPGQRHAFALRLSYLLHGKLLLPADLTTEMLKVYNSYVGKEGETADLEIENMVASIKRPELNHDDFAEVNFEEMYEAASQMAKDMKTREIADDDPMPRVFPVWMEEMGDVAKAAQIPRNFFMMTALAGVSAAMGSASQIRFAEGAPITGSQIYTLGVGDSGSGKSRALKQMLSPFSNMPNFCTDATSEALTSMLHRNPRGVLLKVAEGKQFSKMMGRYSGNNQDGATSNNSLLCEAWSGDTIVVVRQDQRKCIRIDNPHLTVAATIQGHNLRAFSVDDVMEGLMQRLLVFGADHTPDETDGTASKELAVRHASYVEMIIRLMQLRPNLHNEVIRSVADSPLSAALNCDPLTVTLNPEAEKVFRQYATWKKSAEVQDAWPEGHPYRADLVRHAEYALRVCDCLFFMHLAGSEQSWKACRFEFCTETLCPVEYMNGAIALIEWAWRQKQRLMSDLVEDRYQKAMPERSFSSRQTLPEAIEKFAQQRYRMLMSRLKGTAVWTARDYYRRLHLNSDLANQEIDQFLRTGFIKQVGTSGRSPSYAFTEKSIPPSRSERR